eukprot:3583246-Pleurochrysis_carterae.AAC.1
MPPLSSAHASAAPSASAMSSCSLLSCSAASIAARHAAAHPSFVELVASCACGRSGGESPSGPDEIEADSGAESELEGGSEDAQRAVPLLHNEDSAAEDCAHALCESACANACPAAVGSSCARAEI